MLSKIKSIYHIHKYGYFKNNSKLYLLNDLEKIILKEEKNNQSLTNILFKQQEERYQKYLLYKKKYNITAPKYPDLKGHVDRF
tara:strand:+ start:231 stop:479 length:249 start_codon:yes stop_codon:yes gene_type:complete